MNKKKIVKDKLTIKITRMTPNEHHNNHYSVDYDYKLGGGCGGEKDLECVKRQIKYLKEQYKDKDIIVKYEEGIERVDDQRGLSSWVGVKDENNSNGVNGDTDE